MNDGKQVYPDPIKTTGIVFAQGSALIAVIAAIAIFSVLATALLSLTSTSTRQSARSHLADKAYFLAESGYRYATSQYRHPPTAYPDPYDALEHLGNRATLDDTDGRFDLALFSYFYEITAPAAAGDTMLAARTPGSFPSDEITSLAGQKVFIGGHTYTLSGGSGLIADSDDQLSLVITPALQEAADAKTLALPLSEAGTGSPWNITNRTIGFISGQASMFPARNGRIRVAGRTLAYRLKDEANNVFTDIQDIHGNDLSGFNVPSGAAIRLLPYIRVDATGIIGGDDVLAQRTVSYYGTLPAAFSEVYAETFDDPDSILATPRGTNDIDTVGDSNPVLKVTGGDAEGLFLSQLDVGESGDDTANQAREGFNDFRSASGGYLSYDVQTKVGFYSGSEFDPDFIHGADLAAGLSFRLHPETVGETTEYSMYGLSFLNQQTMTALPPDIIPPAVDLDDPALILWQQTLNNADANPIHQTWLAYKKFSVTLYDENFNSCIDMADCGWTNEGTDPWQITDGTLFIETFEPAIAQSPEIDLPLDGPDAHAKIQLQFYSSRGHVHPYDSQTWATREVWILRDGTAELLDVQRSKDNPYAQLITADLTPFTGNQIQIQFRYDRANGDDWAVHNVVITSESPIHNSTMLVSLKEGAVIPFNYTGAATMETGDRVVGVNSGTLGRVTAPPIVAAAASPQGWVLLNSLSDTWFDVANEFLNVEGKGNIATVHGAPDEATLRKANIIKVYYASEAGCTASVPDPSSPLDVYTLPYERREGYETLHWPVQDGIQWTAERDYFRLIQWDAVNEADGTDANVGLIRALQDTYDGSIVERSVILSHQTQLQSPDLGEAFNFPELGLHAMGSDAANHVYFDDFGFRLYYLPDALFPIPLHQ